MNKIKVEIVNNKLDGFSEVTLRGDIGNYEAYSITDFFNNCSTKKARLRINSFGGNIQDAFDIITSMQIFMDSGGLIETVVSGRADSCAGWIAACGSKGYRKVMQFAGGFFHAPLLADGTRIKDLPDGDPTKEMLKDYFDKLIEIFVSSTGRQYSYIKDIMEDETEMDAFSLIKEGFADSVIRVNNAPILKNGLTKQEIVSITSSIEYSIIEDKNININNNVNMKEVAKILNLNPEASQDAITGAVKAINEKLSLAQSDITCKNAEIVDLKAKYKIANEELSTLKNSEIIKFVDSLIESEPAKADQKTALINLAKVDFETFKSMNESVVNKGSQIDADIKEQGEKTKKESELILANEFKNLDIKERIELRNSNFKKYSRMVNAYETLATEIL